MILLPRPPVKAQHQPYPTLRCICTPETELNLSLLSTSALLPRTCPLSEGIHTLRSICTPETELNLSLLSTSAFLPRTCPLSEGIAKKTSHSK